MNTSIQLKEIYNQVKQIMTKQGKKTFHGIYSIYTFKLFIDYNLFYYSLSFEDLSNLDESNFEDFKDTAIIDLNHIEEGTTEATRKTVLLTLVSLKGALQHDNI